MMKLSKTLILACSVIGLSACVTGPQLAPAGLYDAGGFTVNLSKDWNAIPLKTGKGKKAHLLTLDGPMLNSVYLFSDLKAGDSLLKELRKENPVPKFHPSLSEFELVEFVTDSLQKGSGLGALEANNIRPDSFNESDAVRFDFTAVTSAGLNLTGEALMATRDEMLDIILFLAPTEYYAQKDAGSVDAIFNSVAAGDVTG